MLHGNINLLQYNSIDNLLSEIQIGFLPRQKVTRTAWHVHNHFFCRPNFEPLANSSIRYTESACIKYTGCIHLCIWPTDHYVTFSLCIHYSIRYSTKWRIIRWKQSSQELTTKGLIISISYQLFHHQPALYYNTLPIRLLSYFWRHQRENRDR